MKRPSGLQKKSCLVGVFISRKCGDVKNIKWMRAVAERGRIMDKLSTDSFAGCAVRTESHELRCGVKPGSSGELHLRVSAKNLWNPIYPHPICLLLFKIL